MNDQIKKCFKLKRQLAAQPSTKKLSTKYCFRRNIAFTGFSISGYSYTFLLFVFFRYVTFRTAFASLTALFMGMIIGPAIIRQLRDFQIGQYIREEGPKGHQKKAGTPTMGGVLITIAIIVPTLLWADLSNTYIWLAIFSTIAFRGHRLCRRLYKGGAQAEPGPYRKNEAIYSSFWPPGL